MKIRKSVALASVLAGAEIALAACGGSSTATIHGQLNPTGSGSILGVGGDAVGYGACAADTPKPGDQLTVTDASGKVIGNTTLGTWSRATVRVSGLTLNTCQMPFTMTGVPAETRYGFQVANVPGTTWINDISKPVTLSVSSS
jgi:hypothetical protein